MWTHVQLAWWWYLELRRDRGVTCILRYKLNLVLGWLVVELTPIQPIEEDLWISMGTSTFENGGGLIAITVMMQIIAVIVNNVAIWTIIVVMYIIVTLENGALIIDCCRMMMSKTMMNSIGEWRVGQTQHGAAKSMRNLMHSGAVMTVGIHFEYMIWALIIMPISSIHFEHVFAYNTEVLRVAIGWSWQQTRHTRRHGNQMSLSV